MNEALNAYGRQTARDAADTRRPHRGVGCGDGGCPCKPPPALAKRWVLQQRHGYAGRAASGLGRRPSLARLEPQETPYNLLRGRDGPGLWPGLHRGDSRRIADGAFSVIHGSSGGNCIGADGLSHPNACQGRSVAAPVGDCPHGYTGNRPWRCPGRAWRPGERQAGAAAQERAVDNFRISPIVGIAQE